MALTRDQILGIVDRKQKVVDVPEWGGEVIIKEMSGADRAEYMASIIKFETNEKGEVVAEPDPANGDAKLLSYCLIDEDGNRLFTRDDIEALGAKNGEVLERLANEALNLNAIDKEAVDDAKGESEPTQNSDSI